MKVKVFILVLVVMVIGVVSIILSREERTRIEIPGVGRAKIEISDNADYAGRKVRKVVFIFKDSHSEITEFYNGTLTIKTMSRKEGSDSTITEMVKIQEFIFLEAAMMVEFYKKNYSLFLGKVKIVALDKSISHVGLVEMMFVPE